MSGALPGRTGNQPLIKMCGLGRASDLMAAAEVGADLIGMVFAPSRRRVSVAEARGILEEVGSHPPLVGVFVDQTADTMNDAARTLGLGFIQLSGDEPAGIGATLRMPYIKTIHLKEGGTADEALRRMEDWPNAAAFLLDSWSAQGGGSGQAADWTVAAEVIRRAPAPVFLAGGLHAGNVGEALVRTAPWGVDVSSGIERDGCKDSARMRAFARAAREGGV
ncbi:MAG: phosphoribosylanthranilate isomerase [Chloroflexota bacterium]